MRTEPRGRSPFGLNVLLLALLAPAPVMAVDCDIVCTPPAYTACSCIDFNASDPCIITTLQNDPAPGAIVDCSGIDIVLRDKIQVTDGTLTLRADDVTVESMHRIEARRTAPGIPFGMVLELSGTLDVVGVIEAQSYFGGGSIEVYALGDVVVEDTSGGDGVLANATGSGGDGGFIQLVSGRDVVLNDRVNADGSQLGYTRGGAIVVEAERNLNVRTKLSAFGHAVTGGFVSLVAQTGTVHVESCGTCFVKAEGGDLEGDGGRIYLGGNQVIAGALLSAQGGHGTAGGLSTGGSVRMDAGPGGLELAGEIDVTGGEGGAGTSGGAIIAESAGDLEVANGARLTTKSGANGGDGGDIRLFSLGQLTIGSAVIDARGDWGTDDEGTGAMVDLEACGLTIATGASIDARGYHGGSLSLTGREAVTVSAGASLDTSHFDGEPGAILIESRLPGRCSAGTATGCTPDQCAASGTCSNDPTRQCTTNANCTVGCSTGQCIRRCVVDASKVCVTNANCEPCTTGQCVTNPDTSGTIGQFVPGPPELASNPSLQPCN